MLENGERVFIPLLNESFLPQVLNIARRLRQSGQIVETGFKVEKLRPALSYANKKSFDKVWEALVITTMILSAGFAVLILSNFSPIIYLGIFVSLNLIFALVYDFLLLPALLLFGNPNMQGEK